MDQFIAAIPKSLLAIIVLVGSLLLFRFLQPPKTICDAQLERFQESQKRFLYDRVKVKDSVMPSLAQKMFDDCSEHNGPGGCYEFFEMLKKMNVDLDNIPTQCSEQASAVNEINSWVWKPLKLMVLMAWGGKMPSSYIERNGWFDSSELTLFCGLKKQAVKIFGTERLQTWQEEMLRSLPNSQGATREQVWPRTILSTQCEVLK